MQKKEDAHFGCILFFYSCIGCSNTNQNNNKKDLPSGESFL